MTYPQNPSGDAFDDRHDPQESPGGEPTPAEASQGAEAAPETGSAASRADTESWRDDPEELFPASETSDADEEDEATETPGRRPLQLIALIGAVVVLIGAGVGLGIFFTRGSQPADESQVIARVGEEEITRGEFLSNYSTGQDAQALLDQLIDLELVVRAAENEGATVDQATIEQQVETLRAQHGEEEAFNQFLQSANIASEEELRELLARQQLIEAMVVEHTAVEQARSRHILLAAQDETELAERQAEAEELLAQLEDGADFAALAEEHSDDPGSSAQGGELGWMPRGVLVPEFEEAIFSMEPGEIRLVQTQFGWHIIELLEAPQMRQLDDMSLLQTPAGQQALNESFLPWVDELREQAEQNNEIEILVEAEELAPPPATLEPLPTTEP